MTDAILTLPPDGTGGQKVDVESLVVGGNTVIRHRQEIAGAGSAEVARVTNGALAGTEYGVVVRPIMRSGTGGTPTTAATSTTSAVIFASNAARLGATIFNDSTANLFLGFGQTPTTTSFGAKLTPYAYYELPYGFTGAVNGILDASTGNARGQEFS